MSRKYSRVERFIWRDPEFRSLSSLEQRLWLYLLTSPLSTSIPGLIPASLSMVADEMGERLSEGFRKAFDRVVSLGWARIDEGARLILLPGAVKHNPPESPNVITGWSTHFDEIPDSPLKFQWLQGLCDVVKADPGKDDCRLEPLSKGFGKAIKRLSEGFRIPDPDPIPIPSPDPLPDPIRTPHTPRKAGRVPQYTEDFLRFWEAYPWKSGKGPAMKAWHEDKWHRPPIEAVLASIEAHKAGWDWTKDGGKYIPLPATWLNKPGWEDVPRAAPVEESRREREERLEREEAARWDARFEERYDENGHRRQEVDHGTD